MTAINTFSAAGRSYSLVFTKDVFCLRQRNDSEFLLTHYSLCPTHSLPLLLCRVNDTGLLSYKDHLPLSEIAIGDTNRTGSQAFVQIGPLRCSGNRGCFVYWFKDIFVAEFISMFKAVFLGSIIGHVSYFTLFLVHYCLRIFVELCLLFFGILLSAFPYTTSWV